MPKREIVVRYELDVRNCAKVVAALDTLLNRGERNRFAFVPTGHEMLIVRHPKELRGVLGIIDGLPGQYMRLSKQESRHFVFDLYHGIMAKHTDEVLKDYIVKRSPPLPQDKMPEQSAKKKPRVGA